MVEVEPIEEESEEHRIHVDPVGVISEVLNNISDGREAIRELLSNAAAKEVQAKHIDVRVYPSEKGLSFTVEDDGVGMNYTKNPQNPGRLDKFLNIAQGKQSGQLSDEFGAKGFGTVLLHNAREVEVQTWDGGEYSHRIVINEPRDTILEHKKLVKPLVYSIRADPLRKRGTKVTVKGWNEQENITKEFKLEELEKYLRYHTVVGYTRVNSRDVFLPDIVVNVGNVKKTLKPGFIYISSDNPRDTKTVVFPPKEILKENSKGRNVTVAIKGGVTTDTKKFGLTEDTGGVWVSVNGIPYFKLFTNKYARKIGLVDDFIRFVVECDEIRLNMSRNQITDDENYEAFEEALQDYFSKLRNDPRLQKFIRDYRRQINIATQEEMIRKKDELLSPEQRFVWYKNRMLIAEPKSEQDVAALLWILEGMKDALPFTHFRTLQYPGYRNGIDLLIDIQEDAQSEKRYCVYAELEKNFSGLIKHEHDISQMTFAFCWKVDTMKPSYGTIQKTKKPWKYAYSVSDTNITIFEISSLPDMFVGTKGEAKNFYSS